MNEFKKTEKPEMKQVLSGEGTVSKQAWEKKGTFAVTKDHAGRTARVEGWLSLREEKRSARDSALTREIGGGKEGERMNHGCHLIAHSLGGPGVDSHGAAMAKKNLLRGDSVMNVSGMGGMEAHLREYMKNNPKKELYMQADVKYLDRKNAMVTHRIFERDAQGNVSKHSNWEYATATNAKPDTTFGAAVRAESGEKLSNFHEPNKKGTNGWVN